MKKSFIIILLVQCFFSKVFAQYHLPSYKPTWWLQETTFNPATSAATTRGDITMLHSRPMLFLDGNITQSTFLATNYRFKENGFGMGILYESEVFYSAPSSTLGFNLNYKFKLSENQSLTIGAGGQMHNYQGFSQRDFRTFEFVGIGNNYTLNAGAFYRFKKIELSYGLNNLYNSFSPQPTNRLNHIVMASAEIKLNDKINFKARVLYQNMHKREMLNVAGEFFYLKRYTMGLRLSDPGDVGVYGSVLLMEKLNIGFYQQVGETGGQGILGPNSSQLFINYRFDKKPN